MNGAPFTLGVPMYGRHLEGSQQERTCQVQVTLQLIPTRNAIYPRPVTIITTGHRLAGLPACYVLDYPAGADLQRDLWYCVLEE